MTLFFSLCQRKFADFSVPSYLPSFECPPNTSWTFRVGHIIVIDLLLKKFSKNPGFKSNRFNGDVANTIPIERNVIL